MKQEALITDKERIWLEEFEVSSKETAKEEIIDTVKFFNDTLKPGEKLRELHSMPIRSKKAVYFADYTDDYETELEMYVVTPLIERGILFDKIKIKETPPFRSVNYDILFFDWGGMSIGNSLLQSFCDEIIREAQDYPNRLYVMVSTFTAAAMGDIILTYGNEIKKHNIFLDINSFAEYWNTYE